MTEINTFGLMPAKSDGNQLYLMSAKDFTSWVNAATTAQKRWVESVGFDAKPGKAICFATTDGEIDFAVGITGGHKVWDAAGLATSLPKANWRFVVDSKELGSDTIEALALGWGLSQYQFNHYRTSEMPKTNHLVVPHDINTDRLIGQLSGIYLCRDLINQPSNYMTPKALEDAAIALARKHNAKIESHVGRDFEVGFPAINTVGRAAEVDPRLVDLRWGSRGPKITLIGKGITFDSGGLDLKPSKAMEMMKKDMGGAAIVLGLADALMTSGVEIQLRLLVAAAENAVSDRSMRPLDIIDTRAGIKVEVGNTDAEGRLVLADAITYALEDKPDFMVDFATLTGAARVALGTELPALFCNSDVTATAILDAAARVDDPLWRLPLFDDYDRHLDAGYAALSSTGLSGYGGAITAALFLRRFADKTSNWAHIDVMAWNLTSRPGRPKGGEAMGLRALYGFIERLATKVEPS
jgi:leucyl aminopeptidase